MKVDPNFEKAAKVLLFFLILSFVVTISGRFMPLIAPGRHVEIALTTQFFGATWALLLVMTHIVIGIWLGCRAKADLRPGLTWFGLGIFGGIGAVAVYLLIPIYEKLVLPDKNIEQDSGGKRDK